MQANVANVPMLGMFVPPATQYAKIQFNVIYSVLMDILKKVTYLNTRCSSKHGRRKAD